MFSTKLIFDYRLRSKSGQRYGGTTFRTMPVSIFIRLTSDGFCRINEPSGRMQFRALVETKKPLNRALVAGSGPDSRLPRASAIINILLKLDNHDGFPKFAK
jgi:hypothetical protein